MESTPYHSLKKVITHHGEGHTPQTVCIPHGLHGKIFRRTLGPDLCQALHGSCNPAFCMLDPGQFQAHLHPGQGTD